MSGGTPKTRPRRRPVLMANARRAVAELGPTIARIRQIRGLTGPQIEKLTDYAIDRSAISLIESGKRSDPHVSTLLILCCAYDMDVKLTRTGRIEFHGTNLQRLIAEHLAEGSGEVLGEGREGGAG